MKREEEEEGEMVTPSGEPAAGSYTMGYSEEFQKLLRRRSAELNAGYLLPHLRSGMRLLDIGCGPGTISVGLAEAIDPGELHGIDIEESQVTMARQAAEGGGHRNARFHTGSATSLPFDDNSFDAAHFHAVLMHVPDTRAVLREAMRVLKPGGLIAGREMIGAGSCLEPETEGLQGAWSAFMRLISANGGHPDMGKQLKQVFLDAGFEEVRASASFDCYSDQEEIAFFHGLAIGWFFSPETVEAACGAGLATREQFDAWRVEIDTWSSQPGAFAATAFGEAVGRKPRHPAA